jgi:mercuric ion transport protein
MIRRWGDVASGAGTVALSLLSCMACPLCLPLYAGLLSVIGIELIDIHAFFFPITIGFGLLTLGFMAYQIHTHHASWMAFKLALGTVIGMAAAAFFEYEYLLYAFLIAFMGSILWNKRQLNHQGQKCC